MTTRKLFTPLIAAALFFCSILFTPQSDALAMDYQLYKNPEEFGIVVFPKENTYPELEEYLNSINFKPLVSGKAAMRYGPREENETFMMPLEVQQEHGIKMFIIIQVLENQNILIGVYHPDWELTLPSTIFNLDAVKERIFKTLNVFRGPNPMKKM
ncbi:MAG: hypothetical protein G3M78_08830 [Candidatus Nitrohelix vancouverensis]|uniref:DUF4252 domain-containing protein n=1 Tax=Candidatus Nitrohelix vancouverensis TaxID=2705534 RepID=A0A7T0G3K9_9BACT|nr:MAG: hypothetical protein G3M78_08830 [Candidatus Nitrohelix vancouverensis]